MASKFWATGGSSDSESSSSSSSGNESETSGKAGPGATNVEPLSRATRRAEKPMWGGFESSSSDESQKREVKTAKEKKWDSFRACERKLRGQLHQANYTTVYEQFDELLKQLVKASDLIQREGYPSFVLKLVRDLDAHVSKLLDDKVALKKLSKARAISFNRLKARLSKLEFRAEVEKFKKEVEQSDVSSSEAASSASSSASSESSASSSESENESETKKKARGRKFSASSADGSKGSSSSIRSSSTSSVSSVSSYSSSSSSSSSSSVSAGSDLGSDAGYEVRHARALLKWGKKTVDVSKETKKEDKKKAAELKKAADKARPKKEGELVVSGSAGGDTLKREMIFAEGEIITEEAIINKLRELSQLRMKRRIDNASRMTSLSLLMDIAKERYPNNHQLFLDMFNITANAAFDLHQATSIGGCVSAAGWREISEYVDNILNILILHPTCRLSATSIQMMETPDPPENSAASEQPTMADGSQPSTTQELAASISNSVSYVERVDDMLLKSLQTTDLNSGDCRSKLAFTIDIVSLLFKTYVYVNKTWKTLSEQQGGGGSPPVELCRVALRLCEHLYYSPDPFAVKKWELVRRQISDSPVSHVILPQLAILDSMTPSEFVYDLASKIYRLASPGDTRTLLRVLLHTIYCRAIHDDYHIARDLMNTANLQELAWNSEIFEQVLYNRCLAQLGLAAFRSGFMPEAFQCLSEVCGLNRQREVLAQGLSIVRGVEKPVEQEMAERRRMVPGHMHINLDVIECCYNISAMLLEIPQMAANLLDPKPQPKTNISRFRRLLEAVEKSSTPPENVREQIMFAAKAMQKGYWRKCYDLIANLKCWQFLGSVEKKQKVLEMLRLQIRETSLKTYILTYAKFYEAFSVPQLSLIFDLPKPNVHAVLSKMILNGELPALWDEVTDCISLRNAQPSKLQVSVARMVDKIAVCVEQNEAALATRKSGQQSNQSISNRDKAAGGYGSQTASGFASTNSRLLRI